MDSRLRLIVFEPPTSRDFRFCNQLSPPNDANVDPCTWRKPPARSPRDFNFFDGSAQVLQPTKINMSTATPDERDHTKEEAEEPQAMTALNLPDSNGAEVNNGNPSTTTAPVDEEASKEPEESSPPPPEPPKKKLCGVCNEKEFKYKCSRCYLP